nr:hypothetical protein XACG102_2410012 [Xanthomonas citri pv. citri]
MLACHAGGRGFESRPLRQLYQALGLVPGAFFLTVGNGCGSILAWRCGVLPRILQRRALLRLKALRYVALACAVHPGADWMRHDAVVTGIGLGAWRQARYTARLAHRP